MDGRAVTRPEKIKTPRIVPEPTGMRTAFFRSGDRLFSGLAFDPGDLTRKFSVEILVDGYPVRVVRADALVPDLVKERIGDGCYGFSCTLTDTTLNNSAVVEARLANRGTAVGPPISIVQPDKTPGKTDLGALRWLGGLSFTGWIFGHEDTATILVDGVLVMRVRPAIWSHIGKAEEDARAVRAFDFHLPEKFADG